MQVNYISMLRKYTDLDEKEVQLEPKISGSGNHTFIFFNVNKNIVYLNSKVMLVLKTSCLEFKYKFVNLPK